uniref:Uncharacterized protein n=1 Tax=Avena sativa TaxID=4498 RepID=A0ACD5YPQ1_AVESA
MQLALSLPHSSSPTLSTEQTSSAEAKEQSKQSVARAARPPAVCVARSPYSFRWTFPLATMATPTATRKASVGGKAWRLLRLAVLWARKGSSVHSLRLLKTLRHGGGVGLRWGRKDQLRYGEREFSIDETPAFRFRTPSARVLRFIPCIAPAVPDTPCDYDDGRYFFRERDEGCVVGDYYGDDGGEPSECGVDSVEDEQLLERALVEAAAEGGEDAGVDVKADEFIAKFYAQMKLQRQISWLQYNDMMQRSVC